MITITFNDFARLDAMVKSFDTTSTDELNKYVTTQFRHRSEFVCFVFTFEQKFTQFTFSHMLHAALLSKFCESSLELIKASADKTKECI
jgi:hypothetical protein